MKQYNCPVPSDTVEGFISSSHTTMCFNELFHLMTMLKANNTNPSIYIESPDGKDNSIYINACGIEFDSKNNRLCIRVKRPPQD